ncbi:unannotated protein [freshwater metagenome]|uniref:Unannotated protein n=1 Tax=freshwater metagenome TaxID=449393 RepID=A0A6J7AL74_9ZZZZ
MDQRSLGGRDRYGASGIDAGRQRERRGHALAGGNHLIDEAQGRGFPCGNAIAREKHALGGAQGKHARQHPRAAGSRNQAQLHLREPEGGLFFGDRDIAGHHQFEPAAQRVAIDRGDHGDAEAEQGLLHALHAQRHGFRACLVNGGEVPDVPTRDEAPARAGEDERPDLRIRLCLLGRVVNFIGHVGMQGIDRRIVDADDGGEAFPRNFDEAVSQGGSFLELNNLRLFV